ncbi:Uncharacterised protein [Klebsiella pneumoniae]|nr:Uncharacterised protein [Klebsiella pneumoniae]SSH10993.1 Uncharacterised protein [Klebsiella pneumoniae]SVY19539.1 Uncharacterised protein [Klebsiella pneumoniae]SWA43870.1 Uncharacterised protein [Klebsiella pneumoniae]VGD74214.1 Uncharacterised protein [Klebsiella pneumoniae]
MERQRLPYGSLSLRKKAWVRESTAGKSFMLSVASAYFALLVNLLRYAWHGAGSAQGAASRRRPLYPRAPASKIAATRSLRLIPAGFGSGRGSVRAKHGPQPASMRAAPAFRERLSDFEAATPAVSATMVNKLTTSRTDRRPGKSQPPPGTKAAPHPLPLPGGATLARAYEGRELSAKSPGRVRRSCHQAE